MSCPCGLGKEMFPHISPQTVLAVCEGRLMISPEGQVVPCMVAPSPECEWL